MTLEQAISAAGMTPPARFTPGKWLRFPGAGKGRSNRSGWCRVISPTLAIFGDWSSNFTSIWRDDSHRDDAESRRLLAQARERERQFAVQQRKRQEEVALQAERIIKLATEGTHWYLEKKGFPHHVGLVLNGKLLIPMRDVADYRRVISIQEIGDGGGKRFLPGSKTRGGIYRLGPLHPRQTYLCEGYATGLSIQAALQRLPGPNAVIVCFSAKNLEVVAESFSGAFVCADNDESKTGETSAKQTGLKWVMPPEVGTDFNDLHLRRGLHAVTEVLRTMH